MLLDCPECAHRASDRAEACPSCGFPIRAWVEEQRTEAAAQEAVASREQVGEVDCPACAARGYLVLDPLQHGRGGFVWCPLCGHSGRVLLCRASDGYYAVSQIQLAAFLGGELQAGAPGVDHLGSGRPSSFRYPEAGQLHGYDELPRWFAELLPKLRGRSG